MSIFSERTLFAKSIVKEAGKEIKRIRDNEDVYTKSKGLNMVKYIHNLKN